MDLSTIQNLARKLMDEHGLKDWEFGWDESKTHFGVCIFRKRVIRLSSFANGERSDENIRNTILHEIAHAVTGENHNYEWQAFARSIGCDGDVRCNENIPISGDVIYRCSDCDYEVRRNNKWQVQRVHTTCHNLGKRAVMVLQKGI